MINLLIDGRKGSKKPWIKWRKVIKDGRGGGKFCLRVYQKSKGTVTIMGIKELHVDRRNTGLLMRAWWGCVKIPLLLRVSTHSYHVYLLQLLFFMQYIMVSQFTGYFLFIPLGAYVCFLSLSALHIRACGWGLSVGDKQYKWWGNKCRFAATGHDTLLQHRAVWPPYYWFAQSRWCRR